MNWDSLSPTLPSTFDAWEGFILVFALFVLKTIRPIFLKRRSTYVDRFGWAILAFDAFFAVFVGIAAFYLLYPGQRDWDGAIWLNRVMVALLIFTSIWQVVEVIIARPVRVEVAMAGVSTNEEPWEPGVSAERRKAPRRESDIKKDEELAAYRSGLHRMQGGI